MCGGVGLIKEANIIVKENGKKKNVCDVVKYNKGAK